MTSTTTKQWPAEATEDNFREQAEALDSFLKAEGISNPEAECKSAEEFVDTFRKSGTAQMHAQILLSNNGFKALATPEGVQWLVKNR